MQHKEIKGGDLCGAIHVGKKQITSDVLLLQRGMTGQRQLQSLTARSASGRKRPIERKRQKGGEMVWSYTAKQYWPKVGKEADDIGDDEKRSLMEGVIEKRKKQLKRVLLLPPDFTRYHSQCGKLTEMLYNFLPKDCEVDIIPTLGQHTPMTENEIRTMFGSIPLGRFYVHNWKHSCKQIGQIERDFVKKVTEGAADFPVPVEINRMVVEGGYDLIVSIGQVVPHEVLGFGNHNKNFFIGLGSKEMINASHFLAASYGIERNLGRINPPLRQIYNKAERDFLKGLPIVYVLVVMGNKEDGTATTRGLYIGEDGETYIKAARLSQRLNVTKLKKPLRKVVAFMDGAEFKSAWVANKAIYRTRLAIANGGELLIIAPGVKSFGENKEVDKLIRRYGYVGTPQITKATEENADLQDLRVGAAHLIHSSAEGRFTITYAPGHLSRLEMEGVNFSYMKIDEAMARYNPEGLKEGWNRLEDGEEVYFIHSPATGLWALEEKLRE